MIVWSGSGFVVALIGFASVLLTQLLTTYMTGDDQYFDKHSWLVLLAMLVAAALTYGFNLLLRRERKQVVIDKKSGREVTFRRNHSLFFVSVKWWPSIFVAIGLAVLAATR